MTVFPRDRSFECLVGCAGYHALPAPNTQSGGATTVVAAICYFTYNCHYEPMLGRRHRHRLVSEDEVLRPDPKNMTPKTKALFDLLFPD